MIIQDILTLLQWLSSCHRPSTVCQPKPEINILSLQSLIPAISWWFVTNKKIFFNRWNHFKLKDLNLNRLFNNKLIKRLIMTQIISDLYKQQNEQKLDWWLAHTRTMSHCWILQTGASVEHRPGRLKVFHRVLPRDANIDHANKYTDCCLICNALYIHTVYL